MNEKHVIKRFVKAKKLFSKYALPVILCTFSLASAQNSDVKIIGTVLEDSAGQQLFGVTVSLKGTSNVTSTDATCSFSIKAKIGETLALSNISFIKDKRKIT